ncbi:hypothetical protein BLNAU_19246 [Blattamonas nauphoetae]|uniref:Uncharacterized protein n=1 Tax=Blattamonas nauphoetae TaxID=2049346 RepID=A0ABQ9X5A2_9EUKA|nr:hypothetical protein BLNAU_19246 [Blattamonas nauphoetae]
MLNEHIPKTASDDEQKRKQELDGRGQSCSLIPTTPTTPVTESKHACPQRRTTPSPDDPVPFQSLRISYLLSTVAGLRVALFLSCFTRASASDFVLTYRIRVAEMNSSASDVLIHFPSCSSLPIASSPSNRCVSLFELFTRFLSSSFDSYRRHGQHRTFYGQVLQHLKTQDCIDKEAATNVSEAELVSGDDSKEQTILVLRTLHLLRDNIFQYVAPCLITWESIFRYALRLDVTDYSNPVVTVILRFGDICPLIKKAYEQDTTPIDDSPPFHLAPHSEDIKSEDGHFDHSKIEQSVKTAMGNADVGAYTSLSSHAPAIQGGIFYTPNVGHLIKPENVIIKEKNLVKVVICGGHPVKQPHPLSHILENFGTGTELYVPISSTLPNKHELPCENMQMPPHHDTLLLYSSVHCRRLSEGFKRCGARIRTMCIRPSSGDLEMPRRPLLPKKTPPIWPLHNLSCNRRLSAIWRFFDVEIETGYVILL